MSNQFVYALVMLLAGIGIPIMAAMNAKLGASLSSPQVAVLIFVLVAIAAMTLITAISGVSQLTRPTVPAYYYLAGLLFVFYILSITWLGPKIGIGNAVFFVLLGQLISSAMIDHFGLFGATRTPLDSMRIVGLALMAGAVFLSVKRT